jgi:hypothetical protein
MSPTQLQRIRSLKLKGGVMKFTKSLLLCLAFLLLFCFALNAQQTETSSLGVVPRLVNFSGKAADAQGKIIIGIAGITFSIYSQEAGGAPLWMETQNVTADSRGNYTVQLGASAPEGLPLQVFTSGEARWLGVRVNGGEEQPRILLLSVPYALKAADAETVGGLPASAFMLAGGANATTAQSRVVAVTAPSLTSASPATTADVTTNGGTVNTLPLFTTATNVQSSILTQTGSGTTGKIGINTTTPATALDVNGGATLRGTLGLAATGTATATAGKDSQPLSFTASAYNSSSKAAVTQRFQWQAEPAGNDTTASTGTMNLLYASGTATPAETGLKINNKGQLSFAAGQTFPIPSASVSNTDLQHSSVTVKAGTDLTGGGSVSLGGTTTLNLDTTKVPLLATNNSFSGNNVFNPSTTDAIDAYTTGAGKSALVGIEYATSGGSYGVWAATYDPAGAGVSGTNIATSGTGVSGSGGTRGVLATSSDIAVNGQAAGTSVEGKSQGFNVGIWGDTGGSSGSYIGVLGSADDNFAGYFINNSATDETIYVANASTGGTGLVVRAHGDSGDCTIDGSGNVGCTGTVNSVVGADNGTRKISLYAVQSADNWFEDAGSGQLSNGSASIALDPAFAQTVNTGVEYHVFLTPKGDCEGVYVSHETAQGFEVHELHGGHSNIAFDYRIMAKRSGFESVRLGDVTERYRKMEKQEQLRQARGAPRSAQRPAEPSTAPKPAAAGIAPSALAAQPRSR